MNLNRRTIILWLLFVRLIPSYLTGRPFLSNLISDPINAVNILFYPIILVILPFLVIFLVIIKKRIGYSLAIVLALLDSIVVFVNWDVLFLSREIDLSLYNIFIVFFMTFYDISLMYLSYFELKESRWTRM